MSAASPASRQALIHLDRREVELAAFLFARALNQGEDPRLHVNERWSCWMLLGEFEQAWQESDRVGASFDRHALNASSEVLVRCLRGFGDAVQFLRYLPQLRARFTSVAIQASPRLVPLLQQLPFDEVFAYEDPAAHRYSAALECSDLPYLFRTSLTTIPSVLPLGGPRSCGRRRIGIVWTAGVWNPHRAIPFELLAPLLATHFLEFVSLDHETEGWDFRSPRPGFQDRGLLHTIDRVAELDLIITVDTLVGHLAGSIGTPVWTLLPFAADWRWMLTRSDTPWYPSMRLFRQPRPGEWADVIDRVIAELHHWAG